MVSAVGCSRSCGSGGALACVSARLWPPFWRSPSDVSCGSGGALDCRSGTRVCVFVNVGGLGVVDSVGYGCFDGSGDACVWVSDCWLIDLGESDFVFGCSDDDIYMDIINPICVCSR